MFNTLGIWFRSAFKGIINNRFMSFASICIITAVLILLGVALIVGVDINSVSYQLEQRCETNVYIYKDVDENEVKEVGEALEKISGVKSVSFLSKEERLTNYKETVYKGREEYLQDIEKDNHLRDAYVVTLESIDDGENFEELAKAIKGVEEVVSPGDEAYKLISALDNLRNVGFILIVLLLLIAILIVANTIKLGMLARQQEIHIMKFVGADNSFIICPFLIEGIIMGIIAALVAGIVLLLGYGAVLPKLSSFVSPMVLPGIPEISFIILVLFFAFGIGIGVVGSLFSVRRHLKV